MAPAATTAVKTIKRDIPFAWEGKDKRGNRVKGKSLAPDEAVLRSELRRQGIASQLMDAVHSWAKQNDYESIRFECHNQHRPMLHLAIALEYDIVGIRWDPDRGDNLVIFEKVLGV